MTLIVSSWNLWGGDISWGPRYIVPAIPFIILPIAIHIDTVISSRSGGSAVAAIILLSVLSLGVQTLGLFFNFRDMAGTWYTMTSKDDSVKIHSRHFELRSSPIIGHLEMFQLYLFNRNPQSMNPNHVPHINKKLKETLPPDFWIVYKWNENSGSPRRQYTFACIFSAIFLFFLFSVFRLISIFVKDRNKLIPA